MPPKSIFKQSGAQHFQLVHRSQRDPLIHDPDAPKHVLKSLPSKKGKGRAELEHDITSSDLAHDKSRGNIGEASGYGVYYDDTDYDYMQHLRQIGGPNADVIESVWIEGPLKKSGGQRRKTDDTSIKLKNDLPSEVLPSTSELPMDFEAQMAIPSSIAGFRPEMDSHLRQTLEALEDDAFVDDGMQDDFFEGLIRSGQRAEDDDVEFSTEDEERQSDESNEDDTAEGDNWQARFARFKKSENAKQFDEDDDGFSEAGDTVASLPAMKVIGGKRRRKGTSDATGHTMSSSSIFRNEGLTTLDERYDQIERDYASSNEDREISSDAVPDAPVLVLSRDALEDMANDFLDNYEVLGGKMKTVMPGASALDKLDTLRKSLPAPTLHSDAYHQDNVFGDETDQLAEPTKEDVWDCETMLSTYTNMENHPRIISSRHPKKDVRIVLNSSTGLPSPDTHTGARYEESKPERQLTALRTSVTITRPRNESKESKKVRKDAAKARKADRRIEKKATKTQFAAQQKNHRLVNEEAANMRKL